MKPANFEDISEEDLAKVDALIGKSSSKQSFISNEWAFLSELGYYYGWGAIQAFNDDVITYDQAIEYVKGGRRMKAQETYDFAIASIASSSTKQGSFEKLMKRYTNLIDGVK